MMLNDTLYKIVAFTNENGKAEADIIIDTNHKIFEGHFPGQPVLPGVCMMQIVKEIAEKAMGKSLFLQSVDTCKFLSIVDPTKTNNLKIVLDYNTAFSDAVAITAVLKSDATVFLKMKCNLK
jgi:3-hydroxyacyl-[acyl-carrier-protein] dehydratase